MDNIDITICYNLRDELLSFLENQTEGYYDVKACLNTVILNLILLLKGGRQAYRLDCYLPGVNPVIENKVLKLFGDRILFIPCQGEPLLCLRSNIAKVGSIMRQSKTPDIGLGEVLGYDYVGDNWVGGPDKEYYGITFEAYTSEETIILYSYISPPEAITETGERIPESIKRLEAVLAPLGYRVRIRKILRCKSCEI